MNFIWILINLSNFLSFSYFHVYYINLYNHPYIVILLSIWLNRNERINFVKKNINHEINRYHRSTSTRNISTVPVSYRLRYGIRYPLFLKIGTGTVPISFLGRQKSQLREFSMKIPTLKQVRFRSFDQMEDTNQLM